MSIKTDVWQFYQDGEWRVGSNMHNHRGNTEEGGYPTRDLYTKGGCSYKEIKQKLKALHSSINGDCYMGSEWEIEAIKGIISDMDNKVEQGSNSHVYAIAKDGFIQYDLDTGMLEIYESKSWAQANARNDCAVRAVNITKVEGGL